MTRDPPSWLDGSRAAHAVAVALAIQVILTGVGVAVASGTPSSQTLPSHLELPEPNTGDQAVYDVSFPGGEQAATIDGRRIEHIAAEWDEVGWALTSNGSYEWASWLRFYIGLDSRSEDAGKSNATRDRNSNLSTDRMLSIGYRNGNGTVTGAAWYEHEEASTAGTTSLPVRESAGKRTAWHNDLVDPSAPCGFALPVHGRTVNLSTGISTPDRCSESDANLTAVGVEKVSGTPTVHVTGPTTSPVDLWLNPGLEFPVRWSGPLSLLGLPGDGEVTLTLEGYAQGDGPEADASHEPQPEPFEVPVADARPWGPAESNLSDIPLPLSEAYRTLRGESPAARAFLDDHPNAYVAWALMYKDRDAAERPRTTWQIVLTQGQDRLERFVVQSHPIETPITGGSVEPPARIVERDQAPVSPPALPTSYPPPIQAPDRLPVVDGDIVDLMTGGETGGFAPWEGASTTHYGMAVTCKDPACSTASTRVEIGVKPPEDSRPPRGVAPWARSTQSLTLGLDATGQLEFIQGTSADWRQADLAGQQANHGPNPTPSPEAASWPFTAEETAAGAGVVALLSGVLYYVWPKLKFVVLGLYSRIGRDPEDVLENDRRREVFEFIADNPGVHFREIKRRLETGTGNLEHHLEKLSHADLVTCVESEGFNCYFLAGDVDREVMEAAPSVTSETARAVLQVVLAENHPSAQRIAEVADLSTSTAGYHLTQLEEAGLVHKGRDGRSLAAELTELGRRVVEALGIQVDRHP